MTITVAAKIYDLAVFLSRLEPALVILLTWLKMQSLSTKWVKNALQMPVWLPSKTWLSVCFPKTILSVTQSGQKVQTKSTARVK